MDTAAVHELEAGLHIQLEGIMFALGASAGAVLVKTDARDMIEQVQEHERLLSGVTSPMSNRSDGTPALDTTVAALLASQGGRTVKHAKESGGASLLPKAVKKCLRTIAISGKPTAAFHNESMHIAVVQTGIAIHGESSGKPFMCFPVPSPILFKDRLGIIIVSGKLATEIGGGFTAEDEAVMVPLARSIGYTLGTYPLSLLRGPYDAGRLTSLFPAARRPLTMSQQSQILASGLVAPSSTGQRGSMARQQVFRTQASGAALIRQGVLSEACDVPTIPELNEISEHVEKLQNVLADQRKCVQASEMGAVASQDRVKELQLELTGAQQYIRKLEVELEAQAASASTFRSQLRENVKRSSEQIKEKEERRTLAAELDQQVRSFLHKANAKMMDRQQRQLEQERQRNNTNRIGQPLSAKSGVTREQQQRLDDLLRPSTSIAPPTNVRPRQPSGAVPGERQGRRRTSLYSDGTLDEDLGGFRSKAQHAYLLTHR